MAGRKARKLPTGIFARKRKLGNVYYVAFMVDGEQVQEQAGTDLRLAKQLLKRRKSEVAAGTYRRGAKSSGITFKKYKTIWTDRRRKQGKRSVHDDETRLERHVVPRLGHLRLDDIRPKDVSNLIWELRNEGRLATKTIINVHGVLHGLLESARFEELIR